MTRIGALIKKKRLALELTQAYVSKSLGYTSPQFVSNWERGISKPPVAKLTHLSRLMGVSRRTLVETMLKDYREEMEAAE